MPQDIDNAMLETAARHFLAVEDGGGQGDAVEARDRWLRASPAHLKAYSVIADRAAAFRLSAGNDTLVRLGAETRARYAPSHKRISRVKWGLAAAAAAAIGLPIVIGMQNIFPASGAISYQTALGEQRKVTLPDGSHITLDSGTKLAVRLGAERDVDLAFGQARFQVAHDADHPFVVRAGARLVRAVGTDYVVDHHDGDVTVSLLTGRVRVITRRPVAFWSRILPDVHQGGSSVDLAPGEQLRGNDGMGRLVLEMHVPQPAMLLWQDRKIRLDNETLGMAVTDLNRYGARKIVIADDRIAGLRISGVFPTDDPAACVEAITKILPVASHTLPNGTMALGPS